MRPRCMAATPWIAASSPAERMLTACRLSQQARRMAIQAIRRLHPSADERTVKLKMIEIAYGRSLAEEVGRWQAERCVPRHAEVQ